MILGRILRRLNRDVPPRETYRQIVMQARRPQFYASLGVPDTVNGRFDMITLHAFLLFERLRGEKDEKTAEFAQEVFDEMFTDMDHNLREMGVSDVAVGKRVRKMAEVFYGRLAAYRQCLDANDEACLKDAFRRNIFEGKVADEALEALYAYCMKSRQLLADISSSDLRKGRLAFPPPPEIEEGS